MELIVSYSEQQLEATVAYISTHNPFFQGREADIRNSIKDSIQRLAKDPETWMVGTMGYTLMGDWEFEGIDNDVNYLHIDISVDLLVGQDKDYTKETIHVD